jgi:hypothetical protein
MNLCNYFFGKIKLNFQKLSFQRLKMKENEI